MNDRYRTARGRMVSKQIEQRGIQDARVLEAMRTVPRHLFVPPQFQGMAYQDRPLPIGFDQTISQPYIVGLMSQELRLSADDIALEIGTGSGYQAAILSRLVRRVYTIERFQPLADQARRTIEELGCDNVTVLCQDGSLGLQERAPFDVILIGAASPTAPAPLLRQLNKGGRMILPVGGSGLQILQRVTKHEDGTLETENLIPVMFVPLRGYYGWHPDDWGEES